MKMTDVVTRLRAANPGIQEHYKRCSDRLGTLEHLFDDACACRTDDGRTVLMAETRAQFYAFAAGFRALSEKIRTVAEITDGYTRVLAGERAAAPKRIGPHGAFADGETQPCLPGLEPPKGTYAAPGPEGGQLAPRPADPNSSVAPPPSDGRVVVTVKN